MEAYIKKIKSENQILTEETEREQGQDRETLKSVEKKVQNCAATVQSAANANVS